jgi:hypothetical protein
MRLNVKQFDAMRNDWDGEVDDEDSKSRRRQKSKVSVFSELRHPFRTQYNTVHVLSTKKNRKEPDTICYVITCRQDDLVDDQLAKRLEGAFPARVPMGASLNLGIDFWLFRPDPPVRSSSHRLTRFTLVHYGPMYLVELLNDI